jgi:hypothetical protein
MDPNQAFSESACDSASHLQFQISLLRLMDQTKIMGQGMTRQKWADQNQETMGEKAGSRVGHSAQVPALQLMELERLQHAREPRSGSRRSG